MEGWLMVLLLMLYEGTYGGQAKHHSDEAADVKVIFKRAAGDQFTRRSALDKNFIRFGRSFHEVPGPRAKNMMSYSRVSRATKDNFMRFGRPDSDSLEQVYFAPTPESSAPATRRGENFMRFGRAKDNFIRFGRGKDNFMRFGKASKDNFIRFGRAKDNFMRFGRAKDNFIRFGRAKDNFIRFGRAKDNFMRFGREPEMLQNGKSDDDAPKSEDGFVRFNRADGDDIEEGKIDDEGSVESGDLDLQSDKPKNGQVRVRRSVDIGKPTVTTLWQVEENSMHRASRDSELLEDVAQVHKQANLGKNKRSVYPDLWVIEDDPTGEIAELFSDDNGSDKRSNTGSGFIRFG